MWGETVYKRNGRSMRRKYAYMGVVVVALLLAEGGLEFCGRGEERSEKERLELKSEVEQLTRENRKAVIIRRVSEQLEEVAYQQKEISDEQRREALQQRSEAERMRQLAERETERAVETRTAALDAYHVAEEQKRIAELRREEALVAQKKADTLAGLALGRSLGSLAGGQYDAGQQELGRLLGYYAWKFTAVYRGDCYQPAVFGALSVAAGFPVSYFRHQGPVRDIKGVRKADGSYRVVSAGQQGEVVEWKRNGEVMQELYVNPLYDFRRVEMDERGDFYVLDYFGKVVVIGGKEGVVKGEWDTGREGGKGWWYDGGRLVMLTSGGEVLFFSKEGQELGRVRILEEVTAVCCAEGRIFAGNATGTVVEVDTADWKCDTLFRGEKVAVTALGADAGGRWLAVGYRDGTIVVVGRKTGDYRRFSGHISAVTALVFPEAGLLSTAYDGRLNLWRLEAEKADPVTLAVFSDWLLCAWLLPETQEVVCGGNSGTVYRSSVSPERMARMVKEGLTRDFTEEERAYYLNGRKGGLE